MSRSQRHNACEDFRRTSGATQASLFESGLTRRQVLATGLGAGISIYAAKAMPFARMLEAAEAEAAAVPANPVLVSVFLPGGLDLLDTLVPLSQYGAYADLRPKLKVDKPGKLGSTDLGANPALSAGPNGGLVGLFDRGKLGFLPGIDYANPDLSHFQSRHFWESGLITARSANGWLGRWVDLAGSADNPLQAVSLDSSLSPVLRSSKAPVAAISSPDDAQFWVPGVWGKSFDHAMQTWGEIAARRPSEPGPAAAAAAARNAQAVADLLKPYVSKDDQDPLASSIEYPQDSELGKRLSHLAGLLTLPLGMRVVTVQAEGDFDTHDNQKTELPTILTDTCHALATFQADLEARGIADRVLTFVWSEFGRRPQENETGTDHGAGGIAWVQGNRARAGVLSEYPDLRKLDREDNLRVTADFRQVYCSLLEQWLGADAAAVIPGAKTFKRIQLIS